MESNQEMEAPNSLTNESSLPIQQVRDTEKLVYLVIADPAFSKSMAQQIRHFGYRTQIVKDLMKLDNVVAEHKAVAILVDDGEVLQWFSSVGLPHYRALPVLRAIVASCLVT